jgi:hypothetical protein
MLAQILDRHSAKEVLTTILHSILFHRLFGTVKPQTFEVLDVTMVRFLGFTLLNQEHKVCVTARRFGS